MEQDEKSSLRPIQQKYLLKNCFSNSFCDVKTILGQFYNQISETSKLEEFFPQDVEVLDMDYIHPATSYERMVLDVKIKNGPRFLIYKSSGSNVETTGKKKGDWTVIPGWAENGWFFKTPETIALTKGGNKYLTDLAEFLRINGPEMLGE